MKVNPWSIWHEGARLPGIWAQLRGQIFLGSEAFANQMQAQLAQRPSLDEIPRVQWRALPPPLADFEQCYARHEVLHWKT
jgi:hypothetical protein